MASEVDDTMVIRQKQLEALYHISLGADTLCLLPTSSGKSLIFQLIPEVWRKSSEKNVENPIVVVISPLVALMDDQVKQANSMEELKLCAVRIGCDVDTVKVLSGHYNVVFGSPELWINNKKWTDVLSSKYFHKNAVCLVVDEVHKVTWYVLFIFSVGSHGGSWLCPVSCPDTHVLFHVHTFYIAFCNQA